MSAPDRGRFAGMLSIVRYNWPFYLVATAVLVIGTGLLALRPDSWIFWPVLMAVLGAVWFLVGSLVTSHWVYDLSPLYRWKWLRGLWPETLPEHGVICVAGFDEASGPLAQAMPETRFTVVDHFDPQVMTEASIRRARQAHPPGPESIAAPFDRWPKFEADLILAPLAVHELRNHAERAAWFSAAKSALSPSGQIVVAEHLRDLANFIAFGPGFLHFHSMRSWQCAWEEADLMLSQSFRITPFVRIFVLQ